MWVSRKLKIWVSKEIMQMKNNVKITQVLNPFLSDGTSKSYYLFGAFSNPIYGIYGIM